MIWFAFTPHLTIGIKLGILQGRFLRVCYVSWLFLSAKISEKVSSFCSAIMDTRYARPVKQGCTIGVLRVDKSSEILDV